jgi:5'(3')-deoxyribonucleotidase
MNISRIILDLDGVLVNFHKAAFSEYGVPPKDVHDYPPHVGWDIVAALNHKLEEKGSRAVSANHFWSNFDYAFWRGLPWYCGASDFFRLLKTRYDICICTSAAYDPMCAAGKVKWIQDNLPDYKRKYFIGCQKQLLAQPGAVLIDDADHNIRAFREAGGTAILVPRPWNSLDHITDPYAFVVKCLRQLDPVSWRITE